jgi:hypothetical protein
VLGPKKSSTYSSEYASGFSVSVASHLAASPSPPYEGNVGQAPSEKSATGENQILRIPLASPVPHVRAAKIRAAKN